jgi:hypothetical protein
MKKREPTLNKESFLQGMRQKWTGILLLYSLLILFAEVKWGIAPSPYMEFAMTIGSLFILGGSVDSFLKINAAKKIEEEKIKRNESTD